MNKRKVVVLVGDGMGDYPIAEFGNQTPLHVAQIPNMRRIAAAGDVRMVQTVPVKGLSPGSDVANMALLGFNAEECYSGRAPIEAAGAGITMSADDVAFRCNLVTVSDGRMDDYSAGHISTEEASELIKAVQSQLGRDGLSFYSGVSYRHLLIWKNGPVNLKTAPPHDIAGKPIAEHLPTGERQDEVRALMEASKAILAEHPVNKARKAAGKKPATQIWLWGHGKTLQLPSYRDLYGLTGGVITAVDLVRGLGRLLGLEVIRVPGATGYIDTNYEGKVAAALNVLEKHDYVFVHIEAPDECGHAGQAKLKKEAIEAFDRRVVGPVWQELERRGRPYRLLLCTDHRTPVAVKGHTREPVPMAVLDGPVGPVEKAAAFDESVNGGTAQVKVYDWVRELLRTR